MRALLKTFVRPLRSWVYWKVMNRIRKTCVESAGVSPRALIGYRAIVRRGSEVYADVHLGDFSYISGPSAYVEAAVIGKFCSIARMTTIGVSDHNHQFVTTHPIILDPNYGFVGDSVLQPQKHPPIIGNDVWIGMGSFVMRGVTIGYGAVIDAGSVVTKNVDRGRF